MGEYADYILDGEDCQHCGEYIGDGEGFPRSCESCAAENGEEDMDKDDEARRERRREKNRKKRQRRNARRRAEREASAAPAPADRDETDALRDRRNDDKTLGDIEARKAQP